MVSIDLSTPKLSSLVYLYTVYTAIMWLSSSHTTTKMTYSSDYTRWSTLKKINNNKICICTILPTLTYTTYARQNMVIFESGGMCRMSEDYIVLCDDTHSRLTRIANKFIAWIKHIEISQVFMLLYYWIGQHYIHFMNFAWLLSSFFVVRECRMSPHRSFSIYLYSSGFILNWFGVVVVVVAMVHLQDDLFACLWVKSHKIFSFFWKYLVACVWYPFEILLFIFNGQFEYIVLWSLHF